MNGVLNTDNTSVMGLSIDFGPFAFIDNFDPSYTPNHDDHFLRYSYQNQPTIIWWNLVRFGEAIGELMGAGADVDDPGFVSDGVKEDKEKEVVARAEKLITQAGEEYKSVFLAEYRRLMSLRLGLKTPKPADFEELYSELLDTMEAYELDFNLFFRRLSTTPIADLANPDARTAKADLFLFKEGNTTRGDADAKDRVSNWLETWRARVIEDWGEDGADSLSGARDEERMRAMKGANPNFVPRGWVLDEIIRRVEKEGERDVLRRVMQMALYPFEEAWDGETFGGVRYEGDRAEEVRWTGEVPRTERAMQCSCSS
jgi:uncharacterized protein YdiU (UPF0061 family)